MVFLGSVYNFRILLGKYDDVKCSYFICTSHFVPSINRNINIARLGFSLNLLGAEVTVITKMVPPG